MTVQSTDRKAGPFFSGTILPFEFKVFSKEDIQVIWTSAAGVEDILVLDSEYSVTLNPDQDNTPGGSVTLNTAITGGANAVIIGDLVYDQGTDIRNQSGFEPEIVEDALDRVTILVQQLLEMAKRTLRIPASSSSTISTQLPKPTASNVLGWNGEANQLINLSPQDIATTVAFGTAFVDQFEGDGVETEFALSANPALLANMDVQVDGTSLRNGIDFVLLAGAVIKFTTAPAAPGVPGEPNIQVRGTVAVPQGFDTADVVVTQLPDSGLWTTVQGFINRIVSGLGASIVGFTPAGSGAVSTTVEDFLRKIVRVENFQVFPGSSTDSRAGIQAAYDSTPEGGTLIFPDSKTFQINSKLLFNRSVNVDFGKCTIVLNNSAFPNNRHFDLLPDEPFTAAGRVPTTTTWTEAIGSFVNTFNLANTFAVGETLAIHLGTDPYDVNEGHYVRVCKVIAATPTTFTVDAFTPYAINGTTHRVIKINNPIDNVELKNLVVDYVDGTTPDVHCWMGFVSNVKVKNFKSVKSRILFNPYNSYNLDFENIDCKVVRAGISSHGRIFAGWQVENVKIKNVNGTGSDRGSWFFWENWTRGVKHENCTLIDSDSTTTLPILSVSGGSYDVEWDGITVGASATVDMVNTGGTPADYRLKRLRMIKRPQLLELSKVESFADVQGGISFMEPNGTTFSRLSGNVNAGGLAFRNIGRGIVKNLWVYVSSTTAITAFIADTLGGVVAFTSNLVAGQWVRVPLAGRYGTLFNAQNSPTNLIRQIQFVAGGGAAAQTQYSVVAEYWPSTGSADTFERSSLDNTVAQGDFTPTVVGGTSAGTATYTVQQGRFTRIGRLVAVSGQVNWSGHTGTGELRISGLPYTTANLTASQFFGACFTSNLTWPAGSTSISCNAVANSNHITLLGSRDNNTVQTFPIDADGAVGFNVTYSV